MQTLLAQCVTWSNTYNMLGKKKTCEDPLAVNCPSWNTGHASDRRPATFCLFCFFWFLGAIFALTVCRMIILLGCAFPGPMQTSGIYNLKRPRLYNLNHCLTSTYSKRTPNVNVQTPPLMCGVPLKGSMPRVKDEKKNYLLIMCIISGFLS